MQINSDKNPLAALEADEGDYKEKMHKMELEMEEVFKKKVKERTWKLEATELELEQSVVKEKQSLAEAREDLFYRKEERKMRGKVNEGKQGHSDLLSLWGGRASLVSALARLELGNCRWRCCFFIDKNRNVSIIKFINIK